MDFKHAFVFFVECRIDDKYKSIVQLLIILVKVVNLFLKCCCYAIRSLRERGEIKAVVMLL